MSPVVGELRHSSPVPQQMRYKKTMASPALSGSRIGIFPGRKGNALSSQEKCNLEEDIWTVQSRLVTNRCAFTVLETDLWKECSVHNPWSGPCIKPREVYDCCRVLCSPLLCGLVWNNKASCLIPGILWVVITLCFPPFH